VWSDWSELTTKISCLYESNGPKNFNEVDQSGSRDWREAGFVYIVIEDDSMIREFYLYVPSDDEHIKEVDFTPQSRSRD
jgi:hypothetical protein